MAETQGSPLGTTSLPPEVEPWTNIAGTWWFDSALPGCGRQSLLAVGPRQWLAGNLRAGADVARLEEALVVGKTKQWPGGLAGRVTFEGDFLFGVYPQWYVWSVETGAWEGAAPIAPPLPPDSEGRHSIRDGTDFSLTLSPAWTQTTFEDKVRKIQEWIAAGDIYQACLTYPWKGTFVGPEWTAYQALRAKSPAPMAVFARLPEGNAILSASPELFLDLQERQIRTRPIKGTRSRKGSGDVWGDDERLAQELRSSAKERAELTMITDLERNDLGQICEFGSVRVRELLRVERFAQVLHLVSTVEGYLRPEVSHPAALAACFPGGSISGAPKKRALEILAEVEKTPRGLYTGALGYFGFGGNSQFNIPIRTLLISQGQATYGTGAGIVADSEPDKEWEETLAKARGILEICR